MNPKQTAHLEHLQTTIAVLLHAKYVAGAKQHGGNLQDLTVSQLLEEAINECIDNLTYLLTAKEKLNDVKNHYNGPVGEA